MKDKKLNEYFRVIASGVTNIRTISERLHEADARSRKREILTVYPAATVRIEKADEFDRQK
jgi:hypothetical protein